MSDLKLAHREQQNAPPPIMPGLPDDPGPVTPKKPSGGGGGKGLLVLLAIGTVCFAIAGVIVHSWR